MYCMSSNHNIAISKYQNQQIFDLLELHKNYKLLDITMQFHYDIQHGGVAQMVERSLSMREVPGSIPGASPDCFIEILY